jgi:hypothetical protein
MGVASNVTDILITEPLNALELEQRRAGAKVRENLTTTLDGEIVERQSVTAAPLPVQRPEPATWD